MARVLIVHESELADAQRTLGKLAKACGVMLASHSGDQSGHELEFHVGDVGAVVGADVLFVSLNRKAQSTLADKYQLNATEPAKSVKANQGRLQAWIKNAPQVAASLKPPQHHSSPPYRAKCQAAIGGSKNLYAADTAFDHADDTPYAGRQEFERYPDFVDDALEALQRIADGVETGSLATIFGTKYGPPRNVVHAASGPESFKYRDHEGHERIAKHHLKPRNEPGGFHPREDKPRLYFDVLMIGGQLAVVILHLGPHPPEGSTKLVVVSSLQA